jgi:hypothetical protein
MGDNGAVLEGFTEQIVAAGNGIELYLLVKPGTDLDSRFKAWDADNQEFVWVNGWLFAIEGMD